MREGGAESGPSGDNESLPWRDQLSLQVARGCAVLYLVIAVIVQVTARTRTARLGFSAVSICSFILVAIPALTGRPTGIRRAWLIVLPPVFLALSGFALMGPVSGPAVVLTVTLLLAGLLLGTRSMLVISAVVAGLLGVIAWAMSHSAMPVPSASEVPLTRPVTWFRATSVMFVAIWVLGSLMTGLVARLERSLAQARTETLRREQAERTKAEAEIHFLEAKQLETIGRLAAGVAHDFNNNLTAIIGCAELLKQERTQESSTRELIDDILTSANRAADSTRQLLAYSRKAQVELVSADIHHLVKNTVAVLRRSIDPHINVVTELNAVNSVILADVTLLENALLNLLVNARDAMPNGGKLTIATTPFEVNQGSLHCQRGLAPGPHVLVEVLDTGVGIAPENLPKVFEPFFTTKPVGKGTGLGLAAVSGTIKAHNGLIDVDSEPQAGTAFRILLPCAAAQAASERRQMAAPVKGKGEILLVDDDPAVRRVAAANLQSLGYRVTPLADGVAALEMLGVDTKRFDLVVLDLRMPTLSGEATFDGIRKLAPTVPILIWSGYGAEQEVAALMRKGAVGFIQKPYRTAELSHIINEAIRNGSHASSVEITA
jgi:signal transduction histidine kinase/CheY-like chemotaxis protein